MTDSEIKAFPFDKNKFDQIKNYKFGKDWPVVYIIENGKEVYIGETINAYSRSKQHFEKSVEKRSLNTIHIIGDEEYNKMTEQQLFDSATKLVTLMNAVLRHVNKKD